MNKNVIFFSLIILIFCSSITLATYTSNYQEPSILIKKGMYGTGVRWVQDMLNQNGYSLSVDGAFGNATYNAVVNFQKNNNLEVDGIVGSATKNALKNGTTQIAVNAYKYTSTRVNFRSGPNTTYSSYGVLNTNTKVYVYSVTSNGWAYVKYNNTYGYISNQYLKNTTSTSNSLPAFNRNTSNLLTIIKNCKAYYANNNFSYSLAPGVRSVPADRSKSYSSKYYVDCSTFVSWVLYEYALANGNAGMQNYFDTQQNSAVFASIGANGGNAYLEVVGKDLSLAKPGDILVTNGHVEFFSSYTKYSNTYVNIKVYNCGSNTSIRTNGLTTSATMNPAEIKYILRVK